MKRVLAVLMLVALILCAGCGGKTETTEEKLKQQLPELLENELEIEGIYRGGGLTTENATYTPDENGQCFVRVTDENYPTVAVLKEKTEQVFTPAYAEENLYSYAFSGDWPRYKDIDGCCTWTSIRAAAWTGSGIQQSFRSWKRRKMESWYRWST